VEFDVFRLGVLHEIEVGVGILAVRSTSPDTRRGLSHFVPDDAEGKQITARVQRFAADLLGRPTGGGAEGNADARDKRLVGIGAIGLRRVRQ
jgi:hypothetical protein